MAWHRITVLVAATALGVHVARAQLADPLPEPLSLRDAVHYALAHHPALQAQVAAREAADSRLDLARTGYLPRGDVTLQENRATGNVVPGSHFAQADIPAVSGPPTDRLFDSGVWGSTAGFGLSWDVAHLGEQMSRVDAALADRMGAQARLAARQIAVAAAAGDAFAAVVAAGEQVRAAEASVERARVFAQTVGALVHSGLRPGADAARAAAELAVARTQLIRDQEAQAIGAAQLAQAIGAAGRTVHVVPGRLLEPPPAAPAAGVAARNPLARAAEQTARAAHDRAAAARLAYLPRVEIAAALWGQASGFFPGGVGGGSARGLVPDTPNWATGVVVTIPLLAYPGMRAAASAAAAAARRAAAQHDAVVQQVQTQIDSAQAVLAGANRIADETRQAFESSRAAVEQAQARYRAGLYTVDAVEEALRLLAAAQAADAVARVDRWRGQLLVARAAGDLTPLLDEIGAAGGGG